jgi:hypothetical protein
MTTRSLVMGMHPCDGWEKMNRPYTTLYWAGIERVLAILDGTEERKGEL